MHSRDRRRTAVVALTCARSWYRPVAAWDDKYAAEVLSRAAAAQLRFVTNPATNLLLQGRL